MTTSNRKRPVNIISTQASSPCLSCPVVSAASGVAMPAITVIPGISPRHQHGIEYDKCDLLVLTMVSGAGLGPGPARFDKDLGGAVAKAIAEQDFKARAGEHIVVTLPSHDKAPGAPASHVAVVGLGDAEAICKKRICALYNYVLDLANTYQAETVVLPIFPYRSSGSQLSLRATGAILRCLVAERARLGTIGKLKEFRLLCAPQAKSHLLIGLSVERSLCTHCHIPRL